MDRIDILVCDNNTIEPGFDEYMNNLCSKYKNITMHKFTDRTKNELYRAMNWAISYAQKNKYKIINFIQDDIQYLYKNDAHIDDVVDHSAKVVPIGAKTLHRWLNTTATPRMALFDNSGTPSTKFGLTFFITDAGLLRALLVDGADPPIFDLTGTVDVTDGIDRVVTITWDGTTDTDAVKLLANGVVCAEGTATGLETTTPSNNLRVGLLGNPFPTSWPYGDIMEEGLVYSGAWTVAETLEMYNGKKP